MKIQGPAAVADRSSYHLSDEEVRSYDENSYLILRNRLPHAVVERLQAAAATR